MFRERKHIERCSYWYKVSKKNKQIKKTIRELKRLKNGESMNINEFEVLSLDDDFYLLISSDGRIFDKHFVEVVGWLNGECEL